MKTITIQVFLFCIALFAFLGCQRETTINNSTSNRVVVHSDGDKVGDQSILYVLVGHDGSKCPGCVFLNGQWSHVPCQGQGSECSSFASVCINTVGTVITATTTDTFGLTSLDFFNMPARSLITGEGGDNAYLNIPAQLVERDTATLQFTFTGLFYTRKPAYGNN